MAGRGWWRRPPFLPLPDPAYARFRGVTQYGDPDREPAIADVLVWLEWAREVGRTAGPPRPDDSA